MSFEQESMLVILGALIALLSSMITVLVQSLIEQRNKAQQEIKARQLLAYETKMMSNMEPELFAEETPAFTITKTMDKIAQELANRDISAIPTEKLIELYLDGSEYIQRYYDWATSGLRTEAERINTLGLQKYKALRNLKK
jgi:hypothetical protein